MSTRTRMSVFLVLSLTSFLLMTGCQPGNVVDKDKNEDSDEVKSELQVDEDSSDEVKADEAEDKDEVKGDDEDDADDVDVDVDDVDVDDVDVDDVDADDDDVDDVVKAEATT